RQNQRKTAGSAVLPAVETLPTRRALQVSTAVAAAAVSTTAVAAAAVAAAAVSTTTVEAAAAVSTATVEATACAAIAASTMEPTSTAAVIAAASVAPASIAAVIAAASVAAPSIAASFVTVTAAAPTVSTATPPRAGADKHSAIEPLRTVVAVGCAVIGIVSVVSVLTRRRPVVVAGADSDANSYPDLRLRVNQRQHQD